MIFLPIWRLFFPSLSSLLRRVALFLIGKSRVTFAAFSSQLFFFFPSSSSSSLSFILLSNGYTTVMTLRSHSHSSHLLQIAIFEAYNHYCELHLALWFHVPQVSGALLMLIAPDS